MDCSGCIKEDDMSKTVGIVTYAHYDNYGTMLQAYALQQLIEIHGYKASIIDFKAKQKRSKKEMLLIRLKGIPKYVFHAGQYIKKANAEKVLKNNSSWITQRHQLFEAFYQEHIQLSNDSWGSSEELKQSPPVYDAYVVGSDQTWNPYVSNGPEAFFLTFVDDSHKKGSYAPSLTVTSLTEEQQKTYKERLSDFRFLSCRERAGAEYLSSILGRDVQAVIDPTLLLEREYWNTIATPRIVEGDYILTYFLGDIPEHRDFVEKFSKLVNMKVVSIPISYLEFENDVFTRQMAGPREFLALIRDARYVFTDSFHGTMFSINFGVQFFSFSKAKDSDINAQNNRLYDALDMFGLSNRIIREYQPEKAVEDIIKYEQVDCLLKKQRARSMEYLDTMLHETTTTLEKVVTDTHINFDFDTECYGCGACSAVCPVNAISMKGGLSPVLDSDRCVGCGKCIRVCPRYQEKPFIRKLPVETGYVCRNKDEKALMTSSSGGVFIELAKEAIKRGWYVAGCVYDEYQMPKHIVSNRIEDIYNMQGSKYVQSKTDEAFKEITNLIRSGERVLFSGVPCQIAAIDNIVGDREKLLTVAVACHGSIEPKYWEYYLDQERRKFGEIESVTMRDKSKGFLNYGLKTVFKNGKSHITFRNEDGYYLKSFTSGLFERDRCLYCRYKGSQIRADILLADAWGMEKYYPDICTEKGASTVICLSTEGEELFSAISSQFACGEIDITTIINNNQRIVTPAPINAKRDTFLASIDSKPEYMNSICRKYTKRSLFTKALAVSKTITRR